MSGSHKTEEEIMGSSSSKPEGRLSRQHTYEIPVDGHNSLVSECVVSRLSEQCDNGEAEILLVESEQASCSEGSSEEYLKESADMEDSVDEAEEGSRGVYSSPKLSFFINNYLEA